MGQFFCPGDFYASGTITGKNNIPSADAVGDAQVQASAAIQATKLVHQWTRTLDQAPGVAVAAQTKILHGVVGSNLVAASVGIASIVAMVDTAATGNATVTIDVQKRNGAGAWASILSAAYTINSSTSAGVLNSISPAQAGLVTGDVLKVIVTVNAGTGTLPQGLLVEIAIREYPQ